MTAAPALTPKERDLLASVADRSDALVARAVAWADINSGSYNLAGLRAVCAQLEAAFGALPAVVVRHALEPSREVDVDGRLIERPLAEALQITVRPQAAVQVVLTGHYDTVFAADTAFRQVRDRDDGALHGPGVADMKGGLSVMLAALETLECHPAAQDLGYSVLLSPDEEIGSPGSAALLGRLATGGHIGMTYEPSMPDGALAGARKGSGNFHIVVAGRAAHAGREFELGRNAVIEAARIALALDELNGGYEGVTVNVARVDGGAPLNMVPASAVVRFNVRVPDGAAAEWTVRAVDDVLAAPLREGVHASLHGGFTRPPKPLTAAQSRLFEALASVGEMIGQKIVWRPSGGVCEGNNLFAAGLPNIDTLGVRGGDIHSEAEYAWPDSFAERAQLSAALLFKLATGEIDGRAIRSLMTE